MNNKTIKDVWIVHKSCDEALEFNYYVAISTTDSLNYRTKGYNNLDSIDTQLKRLREGATISLNNLQPCDSSGYTLIN